MCSRVAAVRLGGGRASRLAACSRAVASVGLGARQSHLGVRSRAEALGARAFHASRAAQARGDDSKRDYYDVSEARIARVPYRCATMMTDFGRGSFVLERRIKEGAFCGNFWPQVVARSVTSSQAYRKLAMKHHPDTNKNDPAAAAKFSEVCAWRLKLATWD